MRTGETSSKIKNMKIRILKKFFISLLIAWTIVSPAFVDEKPETEKTAGEYKWFTIPGAGFNMLQLENENFLFNPSVSLQLMGRKNKTSVSKSPDFISFRFSYGLDTFSKGIPRFDEKNYHHINAFSRIASGKDAFLFLVGSNAINPFSSYKNFAGVLMYSREIIKNDSVTFTVGGGLAATDFGVQVWGLDVFVVPLPMVHFSYKSEYFNTFIDWSGLPITQFVLLPKNMFRMNGQFSLVGIDLPVDLKFDFSLRCYPFMNGPLKDGMYISAGLSNNFAKFRIDTEKDFRYQYYCAYGEISVTTISLRAGYNFAGKQIYVLNGESTTSPYESGFFLSLQGMYFFR